MLNYHHLRYFYETARLGSMSAAARRLRVTQPTVSAQVRELEGQCGGTLLERDGGQWALTALGHHVYTYAADIFALGEELHATLSGPGTAAGALRIGVVKSVPKLVAYGLLRPALDGEHEVRVEEASLAVLVDRLRLHHLDIVVSDFPLAPHTAAGAFDHPLGRAAVCVYGTQALLSAHPNAPEDLQDAPFLALTKTASLRRVLDRALESLGVRPRYVGEFEDSALLKVVAAEGLGFMAAPVHIEEHLARVYGLVRAFDLPDAYEELHLLSMERHVQHPVAMTILRRARGMFEGISALRLGQDPP
ncbi:MAG: LysR family transcriptional regulator [Myxococcota bacterium]